MNGAIAAGVFNGLGIAQNGSTFPCSTITSSGSGARSQEINGSANAVLTSAIFDQEAEPNAFINGAVAVGVWNGINNVINLSNGSAKITGTATAVADAVNTGGFLDLTLAAGIFNAGSLTTGSADDTITGLASVDVESLGLPIDLSAGILNLGTISTDAGSDTLDASTGGFKGNGVANLGSGNDAVKGFGSGYFDGGANNDLLMLGTGSYVIGATADVSNPLTGLDCFTIIGPDSTDMYVANFEKLATSSGVVNFAAGLSFAVA